MLCVHHHPVPVCQKLGFEGYSEFVAAIKETEANSRRIDIPDVVFGADYQNSYLKNITEAVQVITEEKKEKFNQIMSRYPKIYILAQGLSLDVGWYFYRMLITCGYEVEFPRAGIPVQGNAAPCPSATTRFWCSATPATTRW